MRYRTTSSSPSGGGEDTGKPIWRQPLTHFLVGGILIFALNSFRDNSPDRDSQTITVSASQIERLRAGWQKSWQRPPNEDELNNLVSGYIEEEVYNRQARALQLDEGDPVIRRYLHQKMELLTTGSIVVPEPSQAELHAYFEAHAARYRSNPCFDFRQVSVRNMSAAQVAQTRTTLEAGNTPDRIQRRLSLPERMKNACKTDVSRVFGVSFYETLAALETGVWQGPVKSPTGDYLVLVEDRKDGAIPAFAEIRGTLGEDWRAEQRQGLESESFDELRGLYDIQIEWPES